MRGLLLRRVTACAHSIQGLAIHFGLPFQTAGCHLQAHGSCKVKDSRTCRAFWLWIWVLRAQLFMISFWSIARNPRNRSLDVDVESFGLQLEPKIKPLNHQTCRSCFCFMSRYLKPSDAEFSSTDAACRVPARRSKLIFLAKRINALPHLTEGGSSPGHLRGEASCCPAPKKWDWINAR